jgi:hypothetical protein
MKLADLRKLAIRKQTRIHFPLRNGMECVINEKGVAQVPALNGPPDFNLEEEFAGVASFALEAVTLPGAKSASRQSIGREELARLTHEGSLPAGSHDEHEDE